MKNKLIFIIAFVLSVVLLFFLAIFYVDGRHDLSKGSFNEANRIIVSNMFYKFDEPVPEKNNSIIEKKEEIKKLLSLIVVKGEFRKSNFSKPGINLYFFNKQKEIGYIGLWENKNEIIILPSGIVALEENNNQMIVIPSGNANNTIDITEKSREDVFEFISNIRKK